MATEIAWRTMDSGKKGSSSERTACLSVFRQSAPIVFKLSLYYSRAPRALCPLRANFSLGNNQWLHATDSKRPVKEEKVELEEAHNVYQGLAEDRPNLGRQNPGLAHQKSTAMQW